MNNKDFKTTMEAYGEYVSKLLEMKDDKKISYETFFEEVKFGKDWITYCEKYPDKNPKEKCIKFLLDEYLNFLKDFHREYK